MSVQVFRSKVDWLFPAIIAGIAVRVLWPVPAHVGAGGDIPWPNVIVAVALVGLFALLVRSIRYEVDSDALVIRQAGFRSSIPIASIYKLRRTHTLFAAPAMSLDRIEVLASQGSYVVISPRDKHAFIRAISADRDGKPVNM